MVLAPVNCAITAALRVLGLSDDTHFQNYHRVLNRARWSSHHAAGILLHWIGLHLIARIPLAKRAWTLPFLAVLDLLAWCQQLTKGMTVISRLRTDGALYTPAPPRRPGQRGRRQATTWPRGVRNGAACP